LDSQWTANRIRQEDLAAHDWYRFVLSYPPHLVRNYLSEFSIAPAQRVLDPFCGTGTTIVECQKLGIPSIGIEAVPMPAFASSVKVDWDLDPAGLLEHAQMVGATALKQLEAEGVPDEPFFSETSGHREPLRALPQETARLLLTNSISPLPLHKTLVLLEKLQDHSSCRYYRHELLALAKALTGPIGNLHFGPEVGVGAQKPDAAVIAPWLNNVRAMSHDLQELRRLNASKAQVHPGDARELVCILPRCSVDAVITSPPYPNEKDYTRTTRLESVLLGFVRNMKELRAMKRNLIRSNTRNVYKSDQDDKWVADNRKIDALASTIERRRIAMGKTSGFERLYHRVTRLYFGGMARHLSELRNALRPGAMLAYVVGDQASYLRVMIRTGQLLAQVAQSMGYELVKVDLFRTRLATATRDQLREEVVVLRWPGPSRKRKG